MAVSVELPKLGLQAPPALLAEWYLPDGVVVHRGEALCRIETDNVAIDLESEGDGVLRHRLEPGLERPAGDILGVILASGERMPELAPVEESLFRALKQSSGPSDDEWQASVRAIRYWPAEDADSDDAGDVEAPCDDAPEEREAKGFALVPFPLRARRNESSWDPAPGDAIDFASALLQQPPHLPEPEENMAVTDDVDAAEPGPAEAFESARAVAEPRAAGDEQPATPEEPTIGAPVVDSTPGTLSMRATVDLTETHKLREQLGREWRDIDLAPANEDVIVRAIGRALAEFGADDSVTLRTCEGQQARSVTLREAGLVPFRQAVLSLRAREGESLSTPCAVSLFEGIDEAEPATGGGVVIAFGIGAERKTVRWDGERAAPAAELTITLRYDPEIVDPFEAARFLARVRDLVQAPYALLVA